MANCTTAEPSGLPPRWTVNLSDGQEVVCRWATAPDYKKVLDLGGVYSGNDYLPDVYLRLVHETSAFPLIMEIGGKIVAFRLLLVVEKAHQILGAAARTHPDHRRKKIMSIATLSALKMLKKTKYPELREYVTLSVMDQSLRLALRDQTHIYTQIGNWKWAVVGGTVATLRNKIRQNPKLPYLDLVRRLSTEEAVVQLSLYREQQSSRPRPIIAHSYWVPHSWSDENIRKAARCCQIFHLHSKHQDSSFSFISCGYLYYRRVQSVTFNYHGRACGELLCAHLGKTVEHMVKVVPDGELYFHLHFPGSISTAPLLRAMKDRLGLLLNMPEVYTPAVQDIVLLSEKVKTSSASDKAKL